MNGAWVRKPSRVYTATAGPLSCRTFSTTSRCCSNAASVTADVQVVARPRPRYAKRVRTLPTAAMPSPVERTCVPAAETRLRPE